MRTILPAAILALALTACGSGDDDGGRESASSPTSETPSVPPRISVSGIVEAPIDGGDLLSAGVEMDEAEFEPGKTRCKSENPAVTEGAQVVVRDAGGTTVSTAKLSPGYLGDGDAPIYSPCVFIFSAQMPGGSEFYSFSVNGLNEVTAKAADFNDPVVITIS